MRRLPGGDLLSGFVTRHRAVIARQRCSATLDHAQRDLDLMAGAGAEWDFDKSEQLLTEE
jgi:hypothetical protein